MSPSSTSPDSKTFYKAFGLVVAGLSVGILALGLLVTTSGPRVRHVVEQSLRANAAASATPLATTSSSANQGLSVVFDRPIEPIESSNSSSDFQSAIEIEPKVEYTVSHRNQQLNISFEQNLRSNTEYLLTVKPLLEDALGQRMGSQYTYKFSTAEPSYTYLERNYAAGAPDKVIERAPLSQESYILYGAEKIKSFARNDEHLAVVVVRADNTDELRVVDIGSREEKLVDLLRDVRVDNLKFSPVDNQFVFITRATRKAAAGESDLEAYSNTLSRYDIDSEQVQPLDTLSAKSSVPSTLYARESVLYSRDGQALLYRALDEEYYLISTI